MIVPSECFVCHKPIAEHGPGPETDACVHVVVRGRRAIRWANRYQVARNPQGDPVIWKDPRYIDPYSGTIPPYSTSIVFAFHMLLSDSVAGSPLSLSRRPEGDLAARWGAIIGMGTGTAETPALAICRAALSEVAHLPKTQAEESSANEWIRRAAYLLTAAQEAITLATGVASNYRDDPKHGDFHGGEQ